MTQAWNEWMNERMIEWMNEIKKKHQQNANENLECISDWANWTSSTAQAAQAAHCTH